MAHKPAGKEAPQSRQVNELTALYNFTDSLYRAESLTDVYDATFDAIFSALGCHRASILLFDQAGVMRFVASRGLSADYRQAVDGHSPWKPGDRNVDPIFVTDIDLADEPEALKSTIRAEGIRALGFIPLVANGAVIGKFMTYYEAPHVFTDQEAHLSLIIARQLGFSIERSQAGEARRTAEEGLRRNEERLKQIIDGAREYAIITFDAEGRIASWNSGAERLLGYSEAEILGRPGGVFFTPEDRALGMPEQEMRTAREKGRAANERWHMHKDGSRFWGSGVMLLVEDGGQDSYLKIFRDRTEEREAETRQELLIAELNHRVKNTLASVQSVAEQTLKSAGTPEAFARSFKERLLALSKAHDLLTREAWDGADIKDVAGAVLQTWMQSGRASVSGPDIRISPKQALALSMAFHELMTNAMKYGALSVPEGHVEVVWNCDSDCLIQWTESGGPPVSPPQRQGFGLRVLSRALAIDLGQPVVLDFDPSGLKCSITLKTDAGAPRRSAVSQE